MPKTYRILLDQKTYEAIKAEALVRQKSLKDTIADLVLEHLSPDAHNVLKALPGRNATKDQKTTERRAIIRASGKPKLPDNPVAIEIIKTAWDRTPRPSVRQIAKEAGYPPSTVARMVNIMKERGELSE